MDLATRLAIGELASAQAGVISLDATAQPGRHRVAAPNLVPTRSPDSGRAPSVRHRRVAADRRAAAPHRTALTRWWQCREPRSGGPRARSGGRPRSTRWRSRHSAPLGGGPCPSSCTRQGPGVVAISFESGGCAARPRPAPFSISRPTVRREGAWSRPWTAPCDWGCRRRWCWRSSWPPGPGGGACGPCVRSCPTAAVIRGWNADSWSWCGSAGSPDPTRRPSIGRVRGRRPARTSLARPATGRGSVGTSRTRL